MLLVVAHAIEMAEGFDAGGFVDATRAGATAAPDLEEADDARIDERGACFGWCGAIAARGIFAQVVNDGAGGGERLVMVVEAEAGELGDAELFAENARGVVVLEDPVFEARFDAADAFGEGIFRGVEELLRAGKQRFARVQELEFVAEIFGGARAGKFGGLEFAGGEIDEG